MDWYTNTPIAHRGLHSNDSITPENSLRSFAEALKHGYAIELDVHSTLDNEIVVFHDDSLLRMCGANRNIHDLTLLELKEFSLLDSNQRIPLLDEVLDLIAGRVPILIELKKQTDSEGFAHSLFNKISGYKGSIAVQSFDPFLLRWFVLHAPTIPRGQLSSDFTNEKMSFFTRLILKNMWLNFLSRPHFIAYDARAMPNKKINDLRIKGTPIICWTIKSENDYNKISSMCDNIIFEGFMPLI